MTTAPIPELTTPILTMIRSTLLRTVVVNPSPGYARICGIADTFAAALAARDPQAAEEVAAELRGYRTTATPAERALEQAHALGLDTSTWAEQSSSLLHQQVVTHFDTDGGPAGQALAHWSALATHHQAIAAALIQLLKALPTTWVEDLFQAGSAEEVLARPMAERSPEAAPYHPADYEECWACAEVGDLCTWHSGHDAAWRLNDRLLHLLATDPQAQEIFAEALDGDAAVVKALPTVAAALEELTADEHLQGELLARLDAVAESDH